MSLTFVKRFHMEAKLDRAFFAFSGLSSNYELVPWDISLIEAHAEAKYRSFRDEIDAEIFPCLGDPTGCVRLMDEISRKEGFIADSTWLVMHREPYERSISFCGTVQGIIESHQVGGIQNLGVVPEHRGRGLGTWLLIQALDGFRGAGLQRATLDVTANNVTAVALYRRFGFRVTKTIYKAVEVAYA